MILGLSKLGIRNVAVDGSCRLRSSPTDERALSPSLTWNQDLRDAQGVLLATSAALANAWTLTHIPQTHRSSNSIFIGESGRSKAVCFASDERNPDRTL